MSVTVVFHRLAALEFGRARAWYARRDPRTESNFVFAVYTVLGSIAANPHSGTVSDSPYRWMKAKRFKYVIHYEVTPSNTVIIYAMAHGSRRPGYWKRRINIT
jgi:plasmid stabilization system protein ParE